VEIIGGRRVGGRESASVGQEVQAQYTANGNKILSENASTYGVYTRPQ
jgi:hypothetical protein